MKKRVLSLLLAVLLVVGMFPVTAFAGGWSFEGEGTAEKPFLIGTEGKLNELATLVNNGNDFEGKYFRLTADIGPFSSIIGKDESHPFNGHFDGGGHSIQMAHDSQYRTYCGLFGRIDSQAEICNVNIYYNGASNSGVISLEEGIGNFVGGICGYNNGGTIRNCNSTCTVRAKCANVGGICGYTNGGKILNCTFSGVVEWLLPLSGNNAAYGGIVGCAAGEALIQNCAFIKSTDTISAIYSDGNKNETAAAGGICGRVKENSSVTIENCYNSSRLQDAKLTSSEIPAVGGILGKQTNNTAVVKIVNCYNSGDSGAISGQSTGGIVGSVAGDKLTLEACYWDKSKSDAATLGADATVVSCTDVTNDMVTASSGTTDALVDALNAYKDPTTNNYPTDWVTWVKPSDKKFPMLMPYQFKVTFKYNDSSMGTASTTSTGMNETVSLIASPAAGYELKEWQSDDVTITNGTFVMPARDISVTAVFQALSDLTYVDQDKTVQTLAASKYSAVSGSATVWGTAGQTTPTWVAVTADTTLLERVTVKGDVCLLLKDGVTLNALKGIELEDGNSLTIYAGEEGTGALIANSVDYAAAIGGLTTKNGDDFLPVDGGDVTINGGIITANGGKVAAGIGGGYLGNGGDVIINGGSVTATGGVDPDFTIACGRGIGSGFDDFINPSPLNPGKVTIYGNPTVKAGSNAGSATVKTITDYESNHGATYVKISYPTTAKADYVDEGGALKKDQLCNVLDSDTTALNAGWYVVQENTTISGRLSVTGDVKLILADDVTLTASNGIEVPEGALLTIYAQSKGTGALVATGTDGNAGIGGNDVWNCGYDPCGAITINGGVINANGGAYAAGIGGGREGTADTITINGGTITATGNGNEEFDDDTGKWEPQGGSGIGRGYCGGAGSVIINGGTITATGYGDAGITGTLTLAESATVMAGITAPGSNVSATDYANDHPQIYAKITLPVTKKVDYIDANGDLQEDQLCIVLDADSTALGAGWYVVSADTTIDSRIVVTGIVHIILCDGAKLTASKGITVEEGTNFLTIYGQEAGTGALIATGDDYGAGIGGAKEVNGGFVTINGGVITATGSSDAAGIGGGAYGDGGVVTINRGTVTATGGDFAAGIGSGKIDPNNGYGNGGTVTINGGTVTATGGESGAGIGGGDYGDCGVVTINDGTVTATGGEYAAGIGGGFDGNGGTVTINGGTVTAIGGGYAAGIGGGYGYTARGGAGADVTINGGTVTAVGGYVAASIGAGTDSSKSDGDLTIADGATVTAGATEAAAVDTKVSDFTNTRTVYVKIDFAITYDKCPKDDTCPLSDYPDTDPTKWYHDGMHYCVDKGILSGTSTTSLALSPLRNATRAEFIVMLWRLAGTPASTATMKFEDVEAGTWYYDAVLWAADKDLVNGCSTDNPLFCPGKTITREEAMTMLCRYADKIGYFNVSTTFSLDSFTDAADVSTWALDSVKWCCSKNIIKGTSATSSVLNPKAIATRAELACLIQRFSELSPDLPL